MKIYTNAADDNTCTLAESSRLPMPSSSSTTGSNIYRIKYLKTEMFVNGHEPEGHKVGGYGLPKIACSLKRIVKRARAHLFVK